MQSQKNDPAFSKLSRPREIDQIKIAEQPLKGCEAFPQIASRFEAWWNQEVIDRPIFIGMADSNPARPITSRVELIDQPEIWTREKMMDAAQFVYTGDAFPMIQIDIGSQPLASIWGGIREHGKDTVWTKPVIDDEWEHEPDWVITAENKYWKTAKTLLRYLQEEAPGKFLICSPDWGAAGDLLALLRGSEGLCTDLYLNPEKIMNAQNRIFGGWENVFTFLYHNSIPKDAGVCEWLRVWSNTPATVCACDFSALISTRDFTRFFVPEIEKRAAACGRALYHLDGPDAVKHIDTILEIPEIKAVQFSPPPGEFTALGWIDLFKKIQSKGRSVLIFCPPEEVLTVAEELEPEGLALVLRQQSLKVQSFSSMFTPLAPGDLNDLFRQFCNTSL